jgi:predicted  nucleic acid-binding Zn-ribbon protein
MAPLFGDDKKDIRIIKKEIKEKIERINSLENEVKLLRKEVEFLSDLCKKNEKKTLEQDEKIKDLYAKLTSK